MKLLTVLFLCLASFLNAHESTLFRDEETGFLMQIPAELKRTWNLSHSENGIEFIVFQSGEEFPYYGILFGKLPLTDVLGEGNEGLYPIVFDQVQEALGDLQEIDEGVSYEVLPALCDEEYGTMRIRLTFTIEDEVIALDIHSFLTETHSIFIATAVYGDDDRILSPFTYEVLSGIRFLRS